MSYLGRTGKLSQRAYNKLSFLATAGQTVKAGLSYVAGFVEVYVNGTLLTDVVDYSASNGNSVTFLVALSVDDEVTVVSLKTFSVANMLPLSGGTLNGDLGVTGSVTADGLVVDGTATVFGNVGIGTSFPTAPLHTVSSENLVAKFSSSDVTSGIRIEDTTTSYDFYVDSGNLRINNTAGSEKMRLDSAGNLLVGKTAAGTAEGVQIEPAGAISLVRDGSTPLYLNRLTSDGTIIDLRKDGTTVGSISSNNGNRLGIGSADTGLLFVQDADDIIPYNMSTGIGRDNAIDLGQSGNRFKDLYLSGGVYLGGTAAANKLDDYEEGTWTPSIEGTTIAGVGSYNLYRQGYYTKVGRLVNLNCIVGLNSHTGSGYMRITGTPFACTSNGNSFSAVTFGEYSLAVPTGRVLTGTVATNSGNINIQTVSNAAGGSNVAQLALDPDFTYVIFSVTYNTDA